MSELIINDVFVRFGQTEVLKGINLKLKQGEIVTLLGASGSGKSTLLRAIAGLQPITQGEMCLGLEVLGTEKSAKKQKIGFIFQDYALFPHLSVAKNIVFGIQSQPSSTQQKKLQEMVELFELQGLEHRLPAQLSGGQQQRVAIARSLVCKPEVLLFDEPFSNLDQSIKFKIIRQLRQVIHDQGITAIFVSHDRDEAFALSDRIAVIDDGMIQQLDTPEALYQYPATKAIAKSMGEALFMDAVLASQTGTSKRWQTMMGEMNDETLKSFAQWPTEQGVSLLLRPKDYQLVNDAQGNFRVVSSRFNGHEWQIELMMGKKCIDVMSSCPFEAGQRIRLQLTASS